MSACSLNHVTRGVGSPIIIIVAMLCDVAAAVLEVEGRYERKKVM